MSKNFNLETFRDNIKNQIELLHEQIDLLKELEIAVILEKTETQFIVKNCKSGELIFLNDPREARELVDKLDRKGIQSRTYKKKGPKNEVK